jgi:AraC-like DNA-binding protein
VDITSRVDDTFHAETRLVHLSQLQLSCVRSSAISIKKMPRDPERSDQDAYFAVLLLSGRYRLEQHGRMVCLLPGDMAIYDATQPHYIDCADNFSKLIFAIPRSTLITRFARPDACTALRIDGTQGIGAVTSNFLRTLSANLDQLDQHELATTSESALNLISLALASIKPTKLKHSRSQAMTLTRIKGYIAQNLSVSDLDTCMIAQAVGISPRYINVLFAQENQSLMRYVLQQRLDHCYRDIANQKQNGLKISSIAFRWGFNDLSHFSRVFRQRYGMSPRELGAANQSDSLVLLCQIILSPLESAWREIP